MRLVVVFAVVFLLLTTLATAAPYTTISNSRDWKDVYSVMLYGDLTGQGTMFLVSERHAAIILGQTLKDTPVNIITSQDPFVLGWGNDLKSQGFINVSEETFRDFNLDLGSRTNVTHYIIIDPTYGYNAIAVGPYATLTRSWVIFADRTNVDNVVAFLRGRTVDGILIYGQVDREVREALADYPIDIINDGGDRFANNVEIVKRFKAINDARQVLMSDGEFLESDLLSPQYPVLFIGKQNVPDKVAQYIRGSNIQVGVLIGNDLVGTATIVRRTVGISTFVKFARSARDPQGAINQVEGLDVFYLPIVQLGIAITGIEYNRLTNQLQVHVQNLQDTATYFKGTYGITAGGETQTVGDLDALFLDKGIEKVVTYPVSQIIQTPITAKVFTIFGESKGALELAIDTTMNVSVIEVKDDSEISIDRATYDLKKKGFNIVIRNIGPVDSYTRTEILDLALTDSTQTVTSPQILHLKPGEVGKSFIPIAMAEDELAKNDIINVRAYYSSDQTSLFKILEWKGQFSISRFDIWTWLPIVIIVLLLLLIIFSRRKKKKPVADEGKK